MISISALTINSNGIHSCVPINSEYLLTCHRVFPVHAEQHRITARLNRHMQRAEHTRMAQHLQHNPAAPQAARSVNNSNPVDQAPGCQPRYVCTAAATACRMLWCISCVILLHYSCLHRLDAIISHQLARLSANHSTTQPAHYSLESANIMLA